MIITVDTDNESASGMRRAAKLLEEFAAKKDGGNPPMMEKTFSFPHDEHAAEQMERVIEKPRPAMPAMPQPEQPIPEYLPESLVNLRPVPKAELRTEKKPEEKATEAKKPSFYAGNVQIY